MEIQDSHIDVSWSGSHCGQISAKGKCNSLSVSTFKLRIRKRIIAKKVLIHNGLCFSVQMYKGREKEPKSYLTAA